MLKSDFYYDLPEYLIAQVPLAQRAASRLLCLAGATGRIEDRWFAELPDLLRPEDILVLNDTKVLPARLHGHKTSGGKVEILIERVLDTHTVLAHVRASKSPKPGTEIAIDGGFACRMVRRHEDLFELAFDPQGPEVEGVLAVAGHMPLPPYIDRPDAVEDHERYQTVFAKTPGAVAAPTAGLHFDEAMLARLDSLGVERAFVTLHVGSGTFQPLRVDNLDQHRMHAEYCEVSPETVAKIQAARVRGGRVVAVGTTVVRTLETAARSGELQPYRGETALFIRPGFRFHAVDALVTNFHLPESTLLALVSAFAGREEVLAAYRHAVAAEYRFFSYGDAMFVTPQSHAPI